MQYDAHRLGYKKDRVNLDLTIDVTSIERDSQARYDCLKRFQRVFTPV